MIAELDVAETITNAIVTLLAVLIGAGLALWQAREERQAERIASAVTAYREFMVARGQARTALWDFYNHLSAVVPDREARAVVAGQAVEAMHAALLVVMTADSVGARTRLAFNVEETLREMLADLKTGKATMFLLHAQQEQLAFEGIGRAADFLHGKLPALPVSKDLEASAAELRRKQEAVMAGQPCEKN